MYKLPELLCPAGDMVSLKAAVEGGADAVYFGGSGFNARMNAQNFDAAEICEAINLVHSFGVKAYITQNTLCCDRELTAYLSAAESAILAGADALIVADTGGAVEIKKRFPQCELHASTQMSGHNVSASKVLAELGFSRMVLARECSYDDIKYFTAQSQLEAEIFVHGALCVCHSGQCLFSSVVGGRSGNRGECAQPCRLPYSGGYPLSLKDNCLALHIPELIDCGVASLKIEGRMKSPEYVRDVTTIYRRLLDERRKADKYELRELEEIFSRSGFTDGYFTKKVDSSMLGIRSETNKQSTRQRQPFCDITKKIGVKLEVKILRDKPCTVVISANGKSVKYISDIIPAKAVTAPLTYEIVKKQLTRLGATFYTAEQFFLELDDGLMLPISQLNKLRRDAVEKFAAYKNEKSVEKKTGVVNDVPQNSFVKLKTAAFASYEQISETAKEYFDVIFLPLEKYVKGIKGVVIPPVIFDSEMSEAEKMLSKAKNDGAEYALVGNIGHIELAQKYGFKLCGDFRLNIFNNSSASVFEKKGFECFIVSPELGLPQIRDINGARLAVVYGRVPLMLLEKCVGREVGGCEKCKSGKAVLKDRKGICFPVLRTWKHRSVIYNSLPTSMSDKEELLIKNKIFGRHFIFTVESMEECDAVISAFKCGIAVEGQARRIGNTINTNG